ncbi:hypothetical protein GCM10023195_03940 [Actinoallomurus liliacearum]|uniref:Polyketide cyclase n=1 Tax=Actinoallomurus liliacearum TaxID=1080073 RepID=A0ABP8TD69_9ACTN
MERQWTVEESVVIDAAPERVYEAVADPRRMGEWSPEVFAVWVRGRRVVPGLSFVGFNRIGARVWFTTCRVTEAVPGRAFAFRVTTFGVPVAVWGYRVETTDDGSIRLTEHWEDLRQAGRGAAFASLLGRVFTGVPADGRAEVNRQGMRTTLTRIKTALEAS